MMTIIVADTTCSLPRDLMASRGIPFVPQVVIFGDQSYHDDGEVDTATFLQKLKASPSLPKTAAPEPTLYHPIFAAALEKKESVVVVAPSLKLSGTLRSAETAAQDFPGLDVRIIDTQTVSCNLGAMVLEAHAMAQAGKSADEIVRRIEEMIPRGRLYFVVATLEYLAKGGRIGGAKALVGELIQIKPVLHIREGQAAPYEQQRTRKRSLARLEEIVESQCPNSTASHLAVIQVAAEDEARELAEHLKARMSLAEVPIYELPPAIVVHGGPGAIGVGFFVEAAAKAA
jgi:fatty acid kinase fatty acid binding subunit